MSASPNGSPSPAKHGIQWAILAVVTANLVLALIYLLPRSKSPSGPAFGGQDGSEHREAAEVGTVTEGQSAGEPVRAKPVRPPAPAAIQVVPPTSPPAEVPVAAGSRETANSASTGQSPPLRPANPVSAISSIVHGGRVRGVVRLRGTPPPEREITAVQADRNCGQLQTGPVFTRNYVVGTNGGLANVFVRITGRSGGPIPVLSRSDAPLLDQIGCVYQPYLVGVMTNQPLLIRNSDPVMHNINATSKANPAFNIAQTRQGQTDTKFFPNHELFVTVQCNVHPWMFAYIGVVEHPFFAVTGADGSFEFPPGLPADRYTLEAVHRRAGTATAEFTVAADGAAEASVEMKVP